MDDRPVDTDDASPETRVELGALAGGAIMALDAAFHPSMPAMAGGAPPIVAPWKGLLASFYGGITEELLLRLFLMTLIAWIVWRIVLRGQSRPQAIFWIANVLSAVAFGAGHLPLASQIWPLTAVVVVRTIVLNAVGGVAFGYLYWRRGLEHAMLAHFSADIVIHVIGGV